MTMLQINSAIELDQVLEGIKKTRHTRAGRLFCTGQHGSGQAKSP
uniref:Uncharacterized protein n=1 Tax=uncultured Thiotrichaceae bacterium TaxID=298394 RepID=A0A6S6UKN7_9GAMM|nr:MAG: Unknown protein [uncultured Thiotrichaceae bacterium]